MPDHSKRFDHGNSRIRKKLTMDSYGHLFEEVSKKSGAVLTMPRV